MTPEAAREHLAVALDVPLPQAEALYQEVAPFIGYVKVGLSLFVEHGPAAVRAAELGASLLTIHAQGGPAMVRAAVEGARLGAEKAGVVPPRVLAVTVL